MKAERENSGITLRAVGIAVALVPLNYYWVIVGETEMGGGTYMLPSFAVPFYNVIFCVTALTFLNFIIKRTWKRIALSQAELLTIYALLGASSAVVGQDQIGMLIVKLGYPFWFATPENAWEDL